MRTAGARREFRRSMSEADEDLPWLLADRSWRGIFKTSALAALGWYAVRLALRDNFLRGLKLRRQSGIETTVLHVLHSLLWIRIISRKVRAQDMLDTSGLRRPLVASLGFFLHDAYTLWPTALKNPLMLLHQLANFLGLASIARSENMAFVLPTVMTTEIPTFFSAMLRLLAVTGGPPAVLRLARLLWMGSFLLTKAIVLPSFLFRHRRDPELHQDTLLPAKMAYSLRVIINAIFLASAARDLPAFLGRGHSPAERDPIVGRAFRRMASTAIGGSLFAAFMGLYFVGPVAVPLILRNFIVGTRSQKFASGGIALLLAADVLLEHPEHPNKFIWKLNQYLAKPIAAYFQFKAVHSLPGKEHVALTDDNCKKDELKVDEVFKKDGRYLLAMYPHGFMPVGVMMIAAKLAEAGFMPSVMGASVISKMPILGRFSAAGGFRPASAKNVKSCLQRSFPENITMIVPGGIGEMFKVRPDCDVILADRRGFVRIAVETGAELVPAYSFGNTRVYEVATGAVAMAFERISRVVRTSIVPFNGVGGTLIPFAHPQAVAIGKPIQTHGRSVEDVADEFFTELRRLYVRHRGLVNWNDRELYFDGEQPPLPKDRTEQTVGQLLFPQLAKL
eukprot:TRINITY_DN63392_c0_g1_i1.p1 TRINITY_DN63392_c0_g1~~TRINITY_DN63392_c0_g1_i1.p1  ORF type:complete len:619 (-),score=125.15 TRINITY_DN63392_c0_g1_i1:36-1892(-)